ncbi:MAG: glycoside hydrolase family 65 protein [Anaerolineaceae bacterium]|nr:MAG: glycoside hydrolase family 65 protein [Anaerolineaceae bacterium]
MKDWIIWENGFHIENISQNGNKFLVGNGYLGIRGTLPEYEKSEFPAINLAGIYDQVGVAWREPLNAPNGLYTYIEFNNKPYRLPGDLPLNHRMALDYRHGILYRDTVWDSGDGKIKVKSERFASLEEKHLIAMKYSICSDVDGEVRIHTGIDGDVWDINGPHYDELILSDSDQLIQAVGITHKNKDKVGVCEAYDASFSSQKQIITLGRKILRVLSFHAKAGVNYDFYKYISVYTSKDCLNYIDNAIELVKKAKEEGYETIIESHIAEWETKWSISEVIIDGDDSAMEALNYSIYHLHCIAPRHTDSLSIAARGLSGQMYKGAVFWDTEMFMLDFFLFTEPTVAKTLLKYRIDTLEGAKRKAQSYGYQGAFYAWESQEGGYDACSDYNVIDVFTKRPMRTYFKDKQIHISSAIVYGIMRYVNYTGNLDLLADGGIEVIIECARFYYDLLLKKVDKDRYELNDVIGPDEYHERVNNNAYTNRMAKYTFECAAHVIKMYRHMNKDLDDKLSAQYNMTVLLERFEDAALKLYIPQPEDTSKIIRQFDGYEQLEDVSLKELKGRLLDEKEYWGGAYGLASHTKIIKQADVVTMLNIFSGEYSDEILLKNWEYYEPRTEHGSSLSACMYAMLACKCNMPDKAYPLFIKSASTDLVQKGKQWAGLIYIGGTHPASSGGAYMTAVEGFAGICLEDGKLKAYPNLPRHWNSMIFKIIYRGDIYKIEVTKKLAKISNLGKYKA